MNKKNMANRKLGKTALQEIRQKMTDLRGSDAKQMAVSLAQKFSVSTQYIYDLTKKVRPKSKTRSDKGKRTFEMVEGTDVWMAAAFVVKDGLHPWLALKTCRERGLTNLPSLAYFQRMLGSESLSKKMLKSKNRPYRSFEAEFPGEMYQIDVTALKVRWEDRTTRRILRIEGVDKNHPNLDEKKIRVWQIMAVDDHSRRRFLRYVATTHVTSRDMVEFCIELFHIWGVPKKIYSDNGSEFKGYFLRAERILNKILEKDGGFKHERHLPGNSQATGKVENAHKWAEGMDKLVGVAVTEGQTVTIENLNPFADQICTFYNTVKTHRTTGQTPDARWFGKRIVVRKLPREIIESALLADEFETKLNESMTVSFQGKAYRIPGKQPFVNYTGQKVKVVVPHNIDLILLTLPDGSEWEIEKVLATADTAGEFKSHAETRAEDLRKRLNKTRVENIKTNKEKSRQTGEIAPVPFFNVPVEIPQTNVANFPHQEIQISVEQIAESAPIAPSLYAGKELTKWEAIVKFAEHFAAIDEAKEFFEQLFGDGEVIAETEIETAILNRQQPTNTRILRAV